MPNAAKVKRFPKGIMLPASPNMRLALESLYYQTQMLEKSLNLTGTQLGEILEDLADWYDPRVVYTTPQNGTAKPHGA